MEITETHRFDAPIAKVWEMFHDPEAHKAKFERMGHRDITVLAEERTDTRLYLELEREVDLDVPDIAKKFIKPTNRLLSKDTWEDRGDGTYGGQFELIGKGTPAEIKGRTRIEADGDATLYTISIEVKVKVPLVGGKIADAFKGQGRKNLQEEFAAGDAWLAAD